MNPNPISAISRKTLTVQAEHIDQNGHVNNVVYIKWMQQIASQHSADRGFGPERLAELGSTWFIRSHFIKYHRPALLGDVLQVETWLTQVKRASALRRYEFIRDSDGAAIASGETDWVYIDRKTGRPRPIEEEMKAIFPVLKERATP